MTHLMNSSIFSNHYRPGMYKPHALHKLLVCTMFRSAWEDTIQKCGSSYIFIVQTSTQVV